MVEFIHFKDSCSVVPFSVFGDVVEDLEPLEKFILKSIPVYSKAPYFVEYLIDSVKSYLSATDSYLLGICSC